MKLCIFHKSVKRKQFHVRSPYELALHFFIATTAVKCGSFTLHFIEWQFWPFNMNSNQQHIGSSVLIFKMFKLASNVGKIISTQGLFSNLRNKDVIQEVAGFICAQQSTLI